MGEEREAYAVRWQRVPVERAALQALTERSNFKALAQTGAYLGLITLSGTAAVYGVFHWAWPAILLAFFVHGTLFAFTLNAFHELCHGTVFRSKWVNDLVLNAVSFLSFRNPVHFTTSHMQHHRYTLHPPRDLEVVLPIRIRRRDFLLHGLVSPQALRYAIRSSWRLARGQLRGEWEHHIFPESAPALRRRLANWARGLLIGHGALAAASIACGLWPIPLVTTCAASYGSWLMILCNETQHVGLRNNVPDFRLCCRTVRINPFLRFLYWHMNYHTEHHMYAAVPCYNLRKLHNRIAPQLQPCPTGLRQAWREIFAILERQKKDPAYQFDAPVPPISGTPT